MRLRGTGKQAVENIRDYAFDKANASTTGDSAAFDGQHNAPDRGEDGRQAGSGSQLHVLRVPEDRISLAPGAEAVGAQVGLDDANVELSKPRQVNPDMKGFFASTL
jgi:hypothetical protein